MTFGPFRRAIRVPAASALSAAVILTIGTGALLGHDAASDDRWGRLVTTPIVISPPLEYIPAETRPPAPPRWHFQQTTLTGVDEILIGAGLTPDDVSRLRATARRDADTAGFILAPAPAFVRAMPAAVRARLYTYLARNPQNFYHQAAFRFFGSPDAWLGSGLSPRTRALIEPLIYRVKDFVLFADLELVRGEIEPGSELQVLAKTLLRQSTLLVRLEVDDPSSVESLAEYWGRGGRKTDIRPLLESVAEHESDENSGIDIAHLLPEMARRYLYRYPKVSIEDLQKPQLANCFWTALNFFAREPDDRLLDPRVALQRLSQDYYLVQDRLQLGDIVALSDLGGKIFHVAVYLADDLVFTKNGYFSLAPWTIMHMNRLQGHFEYGEDWRATYYRRKDF